MRLLFLTQRLPYAPNRGDRLRAWHELRYLAVRHEVTLVSLAHDAAEAAHAGDLAGLVSRTIVAPVPYVANRVRALGSLPTGRPLTHVLLDSPSIVPALERIAAEDAPDAVFACGSGMARFALHPPLARFPLVLDMVDADSRKWAALASHGRRPLRPIYAREARCLARFERTAMRHAAVTLVVHDREREALLSLDPDAHVVVVSNGVDTAYFAPPAAPSDEPAVVFCGVMDYPPNEAAARWLARDVWPLVRRAEPAAVLWLVGARPTAAVRGLASPGQGIVVTGSVDDVRPWLWRAAVSAAPLQTARGIQNKVLEAVAAGLPVVVSPAVWDGLPDEIRPACLLADSPAACADAVSAMLHLPPDARRARARTADLSTLDWPARLAGLDGLIQAAARTG